MTKIYVANITKQTQILPYRLPKEINEKTGRIVWGRELSDAIAPGRQVCLGGGYDFNDFEAKTLFEYHAERYGAVKANQYKRGFAGQLWSTEPIDLDAINDGIKGNDAAASHRAETIQDQTAAAILDGQQKLASETGAPQPKRVEIEVSPEGGKGGDAQQGGRGSEAVAEGTTPKNPVTRK